jgi:hypothetical protein
MKTLFLVLVGALYPIRPLARQALRIRLRELGINPSEFSRECLDDLCAYIVHPILPRSQLLDNVEGVAVNVKWVYYGIEDLNASAIAESVKKGDDADHCWEVLARHYPSKYSLDKLASTQIQNQRRFGRS